MRISDWSSDVCSSDDKVRPATRVSIVTEALVELTADIAAAYVSHNAVPISDLPVLSQNVHGCLAALGAKEAVEAAQQLPAVSIRVSIKPDYLVCLEDGKKMKLLKGYLNRVYGLRSEEHTSELQSLMRISYAVF